MCVYVHIYIYIICSKIWVNVCNFLDVYQINRCLSFLDVYQINRKRINTKQIWFDSTWWGNYFIIVFWRGISHTSMKFEEIKEGSQLYRHFIERHLVLRQLFVEKEIGWWLRKIVRWVWKCETVAYLLHHH